MKKIKQWIFARWYRAEQGQLELLGWAEGVNVILRLVRSILLDAERMLLLPNFSKRDREKGTALIKKIGEDLVGAVGRVVKMRTGREVQLPSPGGKVIRLPMNEEDPGGSVPPKGEEK